MAVYWFRMAIVIVGAYWKYCLCCVLNCCLAVSLFGDCCFDCVVVRLLLLVCCVCLSGGWICVRNSVDSCVTIVYAFGLLLFGYY